MTSLTGQLSERISNAAIVGTAISVRAGSDRVFVGMDIVGRYAAQDVMIKPDLARHMARLLVSAADEVDAEMAADAAHHAP